MRRTCQQFRHFNVKFNPHKPCKICDNNYVHVYIATNCSNKYNILIINKIKNKKGIGLCPVEGPMLKAPVADSYETSRVYVRCSRSEFECSTMFAMQSCEQSPGRRRTGSREQGVVDPVNKLMSILQTSRYTNEPMSIKQSCRVLPKNLISHLSRVGSLEL